MTWVLDRPRDVWQWTEGDDVVAETSFAMLVRWPLDLLGLWTAARLAGIPPMTGFQYTELRDAYLACTRAPAAEPERPGLTRLGPDDLSRTPFKPREGRSGPPGWYPENG